jgi:hypothetical protein
LASNPPVQVPASKSLALARLRSIERALKRIQGEINMLREFLEN